MTRALVVIDVQQSYRQSPDWEQYANTGIAGPVGHLVETFRTTGEPVVWVLHGEAGSGDEFDLDGGHVRPFDELEPAEGEPVLVKSTINAFASTHLDSVLRTAGADELVVCGIRTEQCCESLTRDAADRGYAVTFVVDATTTGPVGPLSPDEVIERTAAVLGERGFATVTTLEDVLGA